MNLKIDNLTETLFAQAVALSQNGKMKSTIHCGDDEIFILNMDNTILLKMKSRQKFPQPFSFFANDYESPKMYLENGQIGFESSADSLTRKKLCSIPKTSFKDMKKLWASFLPVRSMKTAFTNKIIPLLEEGLSHIEISKKPDSSVLLIQRDIYSGSRIEIKENTAMDNLLTAGDSFEFAPIGIRTNDFMALFTFVDVLNWYFQADAPWVYFQDNAGIIEGICATCLYDELGTINNIM